MVGFSPLFYFEAFLCTDFFFLISHTWDFCLIFEILFCWVIQEIPTVFSDLCDQPCALATFFPDLLIELQQKKYRIFILAVLVCILCIRWHISACPRARLDNVHVLCAQAVSFTLRCWLSPVFTRSMKQKPGGGCVE